jgi:hypothetical protein
MFLYFSIKHTISTVPLAITGKDVSITPPNSSMYSPHKPKMKHTLDLQISKVAMVGMHGMILETEDVQ